MHSIKMHLKFRSFFTVVCLTSLFLIQPSLSLAQFGNLVTTFDLPGDKFEVDSVNKRMYVSSSSTGNIVVIDANTLDEIATIHVGDNPMGMALSQDGSRLYVARSAASSKMPMAPWTSTLARKRRQARKTTGSRQYRVKAGMSSCGSMVRLSHGSTRVGGLVTLSGSIDRIVRMKERTKTCT